MTDALELWQSVLETFKQRGCVLGGQLSAIGLATGGVHELELIT